MTGGKARRTSRPFAPSSYGANGSTMLDGTHAKSSPSRSSSPTTVLLCARKAAASPAHGSQARHQTGGGCVGRGVSVCAMGHVNADAPTQPVDQATWQWDQQQLDLAADEDGRAALCEIPPEDLVRPLLIARNERDPVGVPEIVVAERRFHEQFVGLLYGLAHRVFSQLRTISPQPPSSLTSAVDIASLTGPSVTTGGCFSEPT